MLESPLLREIFFKNPHKAGHPHHLSYHLSSIPLSHSNYLICLLVGWLTTPLDVNVMRAGLLSCSSLLVGGGSSTWFPSSWRQMNIERTLIWEPQNLLQWNRLWDFRPCFFSPPSNQTKNQMSCDTVRQYLFLKRNKVRNKGNLCLLIYVHNWKFSWKFDNEKAKIS